VVGAGTSAPAALAAELARLEAEGRLTPRLTATADFYHVSKNLQDPEVRAAGWALSVSGLVAGARAYPLAELTARATTRKITTLCCISNELNGDLIGTAEWLGFPLADLLAEVGVQPEAVDVVLRCADDYADSIPLARALDPDTLVVVGMNGQPLAPDHGYPARLIVPGIYGMKNVKWLESIELVAEDFKGYWQTRGWSDPAPNQIWARIDTPSHRERVAAGPMTIAGVASAGDHGIARVEVSLDGGRSWAAAALEPALNPPLTWVRWALAVAARPGDLKLRVRVTDGAGTTAPEDEQPPLPDGATGWPRRTVEVEG
jgi:DMSO/TMAO reductase YedYZ molybdopterin-dependent catalytic subunit